MTNKLDKYAKKIMKDNDFDNLVIIGTNRTNLSAMTTGLRIENILALATVLSHHWEEVSNTEALMQGDDVFKKINSLSLYIQSMKEASILRKVK